jgi:hypothetical protein
VATKVVETVISPSKGWPEVKHAKTAALVAGSVVALGAASPAFAADATAGQHPDPANVPHGQQASHQHAGFEDALNNKQLGPDPTPLVRSVAGADRLHKGKTVGQHNHVKRGEQGNSRGSSHPGGAGSLTKGLPLLGGLPIG